MRHDRLIKDEMRRLKKQVTMHFEFFILKFFGKNTTLCNFQHDGEVSKRPSRKGSSHEKSSVLIVAQLL
jgi:hypothetical protein